MLSQFLGQAISSVLITIITTGASTSVDDYLSDIGFSEPTDEWQTTEWDTEDSWEMPTEEVDTDWETDWEEDAWSHHYRTLHTGDRPSKRLISDTAERREEQRLREAMGDGIVAKPRVYRTQRSKSATREQYRPTKRTDRIGVNANRNRGRVNSRGARGNVVRQRSNEQVVDPASMLRRRQLHEDKVAQGTAYTQRIQQITPKDHVRGNRYTKVTLIEFVDLQCPYCKTLHATLMQVMDDYGDDVNWVYRPFPLPFHEHAMPAALAAECSFDQGGDFAFWQFIDFVFAHGADSSKLVGYAKELGWDHVAFKECIEDETYLDAIEREVARAEEAGVQGTPYVILVNNETGDMETIQGAKPYDEFTDVIDRLLRLSR